MSVRIAFFGPFRDLAGEAERHVDAPLDWNGLLRNVEPDLAEQLHNDRVHIACAGIVLSDKTTLLAQDGDEVALLPPVSGG